MAVMANKGFDKETFKKSVVDNVKNLYRRTIDEATPNQVFQAVAYGRLKMSLLTSGSQPTRNTKRRM